MQIFINLHFWGPIYSHPNTDGMKFGAEEATYDNALCQLKSGRLVYSGKKNFIRKGLKVTKGHRQWNRPMRPMR